MDENYSLNLTNMADDDLKEIFLKMNREQLATIRDMSYYYLFSNTLELINLMANGKLLVEFSLNKDEEEKILKACKEIVKLFEEYHGNISKGDGNEKIESLTHLREELYDLYIALYGYEIEIAYIKEMYEYEIYKWSWKEPHEEFISRDIVHIVHRIEEVLNSNKLNHYAFVDLVSSILSVIPFRLSKYKYFDVLKTTLIRNYINHPVYIVVDQMERYKMIFNSRLVGNYGVLFDSYFAQIQKYNSLSLKDRPWKELEVDLGQVNQLFYEISKLRILIQNLGVITNRLIALFLSLEKITPDTRLMDYFEKWIQVKEEKDEESLRTFIEESDKYLMEKEKELLDRANDFEDIIHELTSRETAINDHINNDIRYTRKILIYYNDLNFSKYEALFPKSYEIIGEDYLKHLIDNLIQYIDRSIPSMDSLERKVRMRRLLASIELPFNNIGEFLSFVEYSLDSKIVNKGELVFSIEMIRQILDSYDNHEERH